MLRRRRHESGILTALFRYWSSCFRFHRLPVDVTFVWATWLGQCWVYLLQIAPFCGTCFIPNVGRSVEQPLCIMYSWQEYRILQVKAAPKVFCSITPIYYSSVHFLFHYPYITPKYYSSFHFLFRYRLYNRTPFDCCLEWHLGLTAAQVAVASCLLEGTVQHMHS